MRFALLTVSVIALVNCSKVLAGTEVHFYGSYTNKESGEIHYDYNLLNYKRGLFLGICPTTKLLQWGYWFDLAGAGPRYNFHQITVQDDIASTGKAAKVYLSVVSGNVVVVDRGSHTMTIDIKINQGSVTNDFIGNGKYPFQK